MDETTANWPVPDDMKDQLMSIMATHQASPIPVYNKQTYVGPTAINTAIRNALVEVHFTLKHYHIQRKDGSKPLDSFNGHIEQVVILKAGTPPAVSGYKRKNLLDGPYRPKAFEPAVEVTAARAPTSLISEVEPVASTSRISKSAPGKRAANRSHAP